MDQPPGMFPVDPATYGNDYHEHLLEQYKLYVTMADKISERRQTANNFFLTVNSFLVTIYGVLAATSIGKQQAAWHLAVPLAGLLIALTWATLIRSYRQLNKGKFKVIHLLEQKLPAALYAVEWQIFKEGKGKDYLPFTHVERYVPFIYAGLYTALAVVALIQIAT